MGDGKFFWWWQNGTDENPESFQGPCISREEAMSCARAEDGKQFGFVIVEADRAVPRFDIFAADRVLEEYEEHNEECWGEDGADIQCTGEQERDLEAMLTATFDSWFKKHGISQRAWRFDEMRNQEVFQPEPQLAQ